MARSRSAGLSIGQDVPADLVERAAEPFPDLRRARRRRRSRRRFRSVTSVSCPSVFQYAPGADVTSVAVRRRGGSARRSRRRTQVPLQSTSPDAHRQTPASQLCPPSRECRRPPQFVGSVATSTHRWPQAVWPAAQTGPSRRRLPDRSRRPRPGTRGRREPSATRVAAMNIWASERSHESARRRALRPAEAEHHRDEPEDEQRRRTACPVADVARATAAAGLARRRSARAGPAGRRRLPRSRRRCRRARCSMPPVPVPVAAAGPRRARAAGSGAGAGRSDAGAAAAGDPAARRCRRRRFPSRRCPRGAVPLPPVPVPPPPAPPATGAAARAAGPGRAGARLELQAVEADRAAGRRRTACERPRSASALQVCVAHAPLVAAIGTCRAPCRSRIRAQRRGSWRLCGVHAQLDGADARVAEVDDVW